MASPVALLPFIGSDRLGAGGDVRDRDVDLARPIRVVVAAVRPIGRQPAQPGLDVLFAAALATEQRSVDQRHGCFPSEAEASSASTAW
jgi:hypothetical protein